MFSPAFLKCYGMSDENLLYIIMLCINVDDHVAIRMFYHQNERDGKRPFETIFGILFDLRKI